MDSNSGCLLHPVCIALRPQRATCPAYFIVVDLVTNSMWSGVQIMAFLIMHFYRVSCTSSLLKIPVTYYNECYCVEFIAVQQQAWLWLRQCVCKWQGPAVRHELQEVLRDVHLKCAENCIPHASCLVCCWQKLALSCYTSKSEGTIEDTQNRLCIECP